MLIHDQLVALLHEIRPNAQWSLDGDTYEGLIWLDLVQSKPTEEELNIEEL